MKKILSILFLTALLSQLQAQTAPNNTCANITPFCAGGTSLTFESPSGSPPAEPGINYGCLFSQPNPAWFFLQIDESGNLNFQISQVNTAGNPIDVDFIAWGPFPGPLDPNQPFPYCGPTFLNPMTQSGCSYSGAAVENYNITGAVSGQIYVVLITNFNGQQGQISLTQTNTGQPGAGTTSCEIVCPLSIGEDQILCPGDSITLFATINDATSYEWFFNDAPIIGETSQTITVTETGTYSVIVNKPGCVEDAEAFVEILPPPDGNLGIPEDLVACGPGPVSFNLNTNNTLIANGQFANFSFHTSEEAAVIGFPPILSASNYSSNGGETIYVSVQIDSNPCPIVTSFVLIIENCLLDPNPPANIAQCDDTSNDGFEIFDLTIGNTAALNGLDPNDFTVTYHNSQADADAGLSAINPANAYNGSTETIYVRVEDNANPTTSFGTTSFNLIIHPQPIADALADVVACDCFTLPALTVGNYFSEPEGQGTAYQAGDDICATQVMYIYAESGTVPNCTDENSFNITINDTPVLDPIDDVVVCDTYVLPTLGLGDYFTAPAGAGTPLSAGDLITSSQTIYVYLETATIPNCFNQTSFEVTVNTTPTADILADIEVCDAYELPVLTSGNYFTGPDGSGTPLFAGDFITATQTVYIYVETGTTPNCFNQSSFELIVNDTPVVNSIEDVIACEQYVLPGLLVGDYYTDPNGGGTMLNPGDIITTSQTIYVYAETGTTPNCFAEESFEITINFPPAFNPANDLEVCDDNFDGFANFDLTQNTDIITGGDPTLVVTYHETLTDATLGVTPIGTPASYNNINPFTQTIYFNVSVAGTPNCGVAGSFQITVNERPELNQNIAAYELCDDNNPGDGIEIFDLTLMYDAITNNTPGLILTYAYDDGGTMVDIVDPTAFENTVAGQQTIFVTAENNFGCESTTTFEIIVNPLPEIFDFDALFVCSDGTSNDIAIFDLTIRNNDITGGVPGMIVTYHIDLNDAEQGISALPTPYTNTVNGQIVFVRVENSNTGCVNYTTLELNVIPGPVAITPAPIRECDDNNDGHAVFNLTQVIVEVTAGASDVTVSFHETFTDADLGVTPILNAVNYSNIVTNQQTIYIRVDSDLTECYDVVELIIIVDPLPEPATPSDLEVCDNNTDGIAVFDLSVVIPEVLDGADPALHTISFHLSQATATAGTNPILNVTNFANTLANQQTLWVRMTINATGCFDIVPLTLIVHPLPVVPASLPSYSLCETDPTDQQEVFDLVTYVSQYITDPVMAVTFHFDQSDADANVNPLPALYTNQANPQTIWVRVTNSETGCYSLTVLDLRVEPRPVLSLPLNPVTICDADGNGFGFFDLDALLGQLLNGASDVTVTFHETLTDAELNNNALSSPYQNIVPFVEFIFIRAQDDLTGCYNTFMIELNVNPSPVLPTDLTDLVLCDQDNNPQNAQTFFNLSVQTPVILDAQTPGNYSVRYFTSEAAANANTPAIINITNYPNATNPQTIWYRVQDMDTGCFTVGNFQLIVNTPLALVTPPALALCDDNDDGFLAFDLTIRSTLIAQGLDDHTVTYYPSYTEALAQTNPIADPTAYTNAVNPQTLGVVVTTPEGCTSVTTLTIRVLNLPTPNTAPALLVACDDEFPGDGLTFFDITVNEGFIADGDNSLTFAYYPSQQDAIENTNEILDPTNYQGTTGIIWVKVMNQQIDYNGEACYVLVAQELLVNPQPEIVEDLVYPICMRNSTGVAVFTLSSMDAELLGPDQDVTDYTVSYYLTAEDAEAGVNPLPDTYTNITNPQEIYIGVVNNATGCVNPIGSLTLIVEEAAVGNPVNVDDPALTQCDTDGTNDGQIAFDLTQFTGDIIAANPQGVTIHYYDNMDDLNADLAAGLGVHDNAIANPAAYINIIPGGQSVYALLVNMDTTTGCPDIVEIPLTVHLLPEPILEDGLVCLDFETGDVLSDYTFNTGLDETTHSFVWTYNSTPLPQDSASITVTQPGTYTVTATNLITGCVSETQTAVVVQSGAPIVSAAVSNAFTENQIITVTATGNTVGGLNPNWVYALDFGPFQDSNVFENVSPGIHTITVMDLNGCGETTITVTAINYPKYFTPNGDGYNDTWNIIGLNQQPNAIIYIFDRYGKLLKQISPTSAGWDGTFNGQPLPSTDYWFTVNYSEDNQWKEFKAHFSLKR